MPGPVPLVAAAAMAAAAAEAAAGDMPGGGGGGGCDGGDLWVIWKKGLKFRLNKGYKKQYLSLETTYLLS